MFSTQRVRNGLWGFSTPRRRRKGSALCANKARTVPELNAMHPPPQAEGIGWGQAMACPYTAFGRKSSPVALEGIHQGGRPWPARTGLLVKIIS